jgi:hypothetical protein
VSTHLVEGSFKGRFQRNEFLNLSPLRRSLREELRYGFSPHGVRRPWAALHELLNGLGLSLNLRRTVSAQAKLLNEGAQKVGRAWTDSCEIENAGKWGSFVIECPVHEIALSEHASCHPRLNRCRR